MLSGLAALSLLMMPLISRRRCSVLGSLALLLVIATGLVLGCGGGSSNSGGPGTTSPAPPSGGSSSVTPPGNYTLTVKATSGNVMAAQALTLTVQ
jgi:hypothetical protein